MSRVMRPAAVVDYPYCDGRPMAESEAQLRAILYLVTALYAHFRDLRPYRDIPPRAVVDADCLPIQRILPIDGCTMRRNPTNCAARGTIHDLVRRGSIRFRDAGVMTRAVSSRWSFVSWREARGRETVGPGIH